jgi:hypothetical protein
MAQQNNFPPNQTVSSSLLGQRLGRIRVSRIAKRNHMPPCDLMKPDLLSEIVLLTFGTLMLASLVLFLATTFAQP